jgi:hypothetical protein
MKTLSGTFVFVALAVITIVTLSSGCRKQDSEEVLTDKKFKFTLKIGRTDDDFVDVKSQDEFDEALCALKANGHFNVGFKKGPNATPTPHYTPSCPQGSINTDKITTSGAARTEPAEESSAYDPNAVYRVYSNSTEDIKRVLDTFQTPSPTPSPQ